MSKRRVLNHDQMASIIDALHTVPEKNWISMKDDMWDLVTTVHDMEQRAERYEAALRTLVEAAQDALYTLHEARPPEPTKLYVRRDYMDALNKALAQARAALPPEQEDGWGPATKDEVTQLKSSLRAALDHAMGLDEEEAK